MTEGSRPANSSCTPGLPNTTLAGILLGGALALVAGLCLLWITPQITLAYPSVSVEQYVRQFEQSYSRVKAVQADFTQTYFAWGRTRVESGTVYLARGGRMRWVYREPEEKIFLTNGKHLLIYLPAERQLRISSLQDVENAPVPLDLLLSHIQMSKFFSHIEFAGRALEAAPGDHVIRGSPKPKFRQAFRSCLIELSPSFDVRKLVVFYPDNSTMQFELSHIQRNPPINPSLFSFTPPSGTEIIRQ